MPENKPPLDFNADGWAPTGAVRVRTGWFGFAVVEEQVEHHLGSRDWRRIRSPRLIEIPELLRRA